MKDVFISYKAEEAEEANWVRSVLETNGVSCWMAPANIPGGSNYAVEIPKAIRNCKVFVLLLSSRSQGSMWVTKEVDCAINYGKIVLPFMLENCTLKEEFNFYLTNVQRYAAFENKSSEIKRMVMDIKAIINNADQTPVNIPTPAPAPKPTPTAVEGAAKFSLGCRIGFIAGLLLGFINIMISLWGRSDPGDFSDGIFFFLPLALASAVISLLQLMKIKRKGGMSSAYFVLYIVCLLASVFCVINNLSILGSVL